jgi:hypothetical protein
VLCDAYVLKLLRFVTSTWCAATFSHSYVKWHLRYVMLRFVAVPIFHLFDFNYFYVIKSLLVGGSKAEIKIFFFFFNVGQIRTNLSLLAYAPSTLATILTLS